MLEYRAAAMAILFALSVFGFSGDARSEAIWAQSDSDTAVEWSGSKSDVHGLVHSNGGIKISGSKNTFDGGTQYVTSFVNHKPSGPNVNIVSPAAVQISAQPFPRAYPITDYMPGGAAAVQAGADYVDMTAACASNGSASVLVSFHNEAIPDRLYWVPCDVSFDAKGSSGNVTVVSSGDIHYKTHKNSQISGYTDGILALTSSAGTKAIHLHGNTSTMHGDLIAESGEIHIAGSNQTFSCGVYGNTLKFSGSSFSVAGADCATAQNSPPMAVDDLAYTLENVTVSIDILANDTDSDGSLIPSSVTIVTAATSGSVAIDPVSGVASYTPSLNFSGTDSFQYTVEDDVGAVSQVATVNIDVEDVNEAPVAVDDLAVTDEDVAVTISVLTNDSDGDGTIDVSSVVVTSAPLNGTAVVDLVTGQITYTPDPDFFGADNFDYTVQDDQGALSNTGTVSIDIAPINDAPVANDAVINVDEDNSVAIALTASDIDGNALTYSIVDGPANGSLGGTAPNLTYTPTDNFNGGDSFSFVANDGVADSSVATISIGVAPVNDDPTVADQIFTGSEDTTLGVSVVATDIDGDALTYTVLTQPVNGMLAGAGPDYVFTPNANFNGSDSFVVEVDDGLGGTTTATITLSIGSVNDRPSAFDQSVSTNEDTPLAIALSGADVDGDVLTFAVQTTPINGALTGTPPNLTYTPNANFSGADSFTFVVNDGLLDSLIATVSIDITAVNDPPVADAIAITLAEDTSQSLTLTGSDSEGDALTFSVVSQPANGVLSGVAPALTYTPNADFFGSDNFQYLANDGVLDSAPATVDITVTADAGDAPTADSQQLGTNENIAIGITLTGADPDNDPITFQVVDGPTNGTLFGDAPNLTYLPDAYFEGADSFTFLTSDGALESQVAVVSIDVLGHGNNPPTITSDPVETHMLDLSLSPAEPFDFRTWQQYDYATAGHGGTPTWVISEDGTVVTQIGNSPTSSLVVPANLSNVLIQGTFSVQTGADDDNLGLLFGYQGPSRTYLFQWRQSTQGNFSRGMSLYAVDIEESGWNGILLANDDFPGLLYRNDVPWLDFVEYDFSLSFQPGLISMTVVDDAGVIADSFVVSDDTYADGQFGVYTHSQNQTRYEGFTFQLQADNTYMYPVMALDPDGDALTYSLLDAPTGMTIDATTGLITWATEEADIGSVTVVIEVQDVFGASDQQTYVLAVTNDAPVFVGTPATLAYANEDYADKLTAFDPDPTDTLTYSLLDAPAGMTVTPTTGELNWLPGSSQLGIHPITAEVVDGQGNSDTLDYVMTVEDRPGNAAPVFNTTPPPIATVGAQYVYTPIATDADGDNITYSLAGELPYDMQMFDGINITWIPTADQVTDWTVTLEALDGNGGVTAQTWIIQVQAIDDNTAPVILSAAQTTADVDVDYTYQVVATDVDGDTLTYSLVDGPPTMAIDSATGLLTWTPLTDDVGFADVTLRVTDGNGGFAEESFTLGVRNPTVNQAPVISSTPATTAALSTAYAYQVVAVDVDGDTLTYTLPTAPSGMSIATNGRIDWTPVGGQSGSHSVSIEVSDGNGGTATQSFAVFVPATGTDSSNNGPTISSTPGFQVEAGLDYVYAIVAADADGDSLEYRVMQGPSGMTVDTGGVVRWPTTADDAGDYTVRVEVTDGRGGSALQGYRLAVYEPGVPPTNMAPEISSTPNSYGKAGTPYSYAIVASDIDGDPLTYALTQGPAGMSIDGAGVVTWTPDAAGDRTVRIQVSDGNTFVEQGWTVQVSDAADVVEASVVVQPSVVNLGGTTTVSVTFAGASGPVTTSLTIDGNPVVLDANNTAVVTADTLGTFTAEATVSDSFGSDVASTTYTVVTGVPNTAPTILSAPPITAKATYEYQYAVIADDAEGDLITYSVETGPAGMSIDGSGLLTWTPAAFGVESVVVRASDGQAFADQGWVISISDADIPLQASISANPTVADLGSTVDLTIGYSGAAGEVSLSLNVDGDVVPVDVNGNATVAADTVGLHTATAIVTDPYSTDSASLTYTVVDPNSTSSPPVVSLTSPDFEEEVTAPRDAIGSVTDPDNDLLTWSLILQSRGAAPTEFTTIADGTTEIPSGVLGQIDPTMLLNGLYSLVLQATDAAGNVSQDSRIIRVTGDLKIGNFSITFEDFSAPVAGLPVTVLRTYDTRRRNEQLDFGYGWSIDYQNVRLQESRDIGFSWTLIEEDLGFFSQWCVRPNGDPTVTVRMPDGEIESFVARAEPECTQIVPTIDVQIVFDPIDGTDSTLEQLDFGVVRIVGNNIVDLSEPGTPIDPEGYRLTTPEGLVFTLDQSFGIEQVEEPNGSTLTFSSAGVVHSQGFALTFNRDAQGRIESIVAPDGSTLGYTYDANGDLETFTDQVQQTTNYTYKLGVEHYLEDIIDPRGIRVSRNEYDADGRLTAIIDADGNRIEYDHDIIGRTETIRDRRGNPTVYIYDDEGNILLETNALGESITRTYDSDRNELSMTNDLGHTTSWTYDERGNQLTETNALMQTTISTYDDRNLLLTVTDALNNPVMSNVYDARNTNLLTMTDALGHTTTFHWDAGIGGGCSTGASLGTTDVLLQRTTIQPQCVGPFAELPLWQEDARGTRTSFGYDDLGRQVTEVTTRTDAQGVEHTLTTTMAYDDKGRLTTVTDPAGNVRTTEYNAIDKESATIDANLNRTEYEYDDRGNLILTRYPDLTTETTGYDEAGNVVSQTDRLGRTTTMVYDAANRLTETIFPDDTPGNDLDNPRTTNEYDRAGRLTATIDERGNRTEFEYDNAGRRTLVRDALLQETTFEYDARGLRTAMVDALGRRTEYVYDNAGRLIETIFPDDTPGDALDNLRSSTGYDALGRKTSETDLAGLTTSFEYDAVGNLTAVIDALNRRTEYGYDEQSNKTSQTDAENRTTSWAYDDLGRMVSRTLPEGQSESFVYDDNGNRTSHTDFNGAVHTFGYDDLNRQTTATYADGVIVTTTYTGVGQIDTVTDARGATVFGYDERDRLTSITYPNGKTIDYGYDPAGNRSSLTTANQSLSYSFDVLNRLATVTDEAGTTTYGYDGVGNRASIDYANGTRTAYAYDALNRLTRLDQFDTLDVLFDQHSYVLGANGNRTQHAELNGRVVDYGYDDLYRLISETVTDPNLGDRTASWTYDAVGNRLSQVVADASGTDTTTYTYDLNDRLLSETVTGVNPDTVTYSYDNNGNTLTKSDGAGPTTYAYDSRNRLSNLNSGQTTYLYDASGIRMSETSSGLTTHYLTDPNRDYAQVIEESFDLNAFAEVKYSYGDDLIAQHRRVDATTTTSSTYHYDGIGSTRALTDTLGAVTDTYAFTAFGETEGTTGFTANDYLYTGEQFDPNLGFYYLRARYYNQAVGRFWRMDEFPGFETIPSSLNDFAYSANDPSNETDPSGLSNLVELNISTNIRSSQKAVPAASSKALAIARNVKIWDVYAYQIAWPWHSYMFLEKRKSGSGLRYDVGAAGGWTQILSSPFRTHSGIVTARPATRVSLRGKRIRVARFTLGQQLIWHASVVGHDQMSCAIDYRLVPGPNCTTWTISAIAKAILISRIRT